MPSFHVCSNVESVTNPQFLNQEPPRAQQLSSPDFFIVLHFGHPLPLDTTALVVVDASASIYKPCRGCDEKGEVTIMGFAQLTFGGG